MRRYIGLFAVLLCVTVTTNLTFPTAAFALFGRSKQEVSKSCSKQADAKGLHGKGHPGDHFASGGGVKVLQLPLQDFTNRLAALLSY